MSIEDFGDKVQAIATSAQTIFTFPYKIFNAEDIKVYLLTVGSESNPPGNLLTLNIDYTVEFSADTGGTVTLLVPATTGDVITLERAIPNSRDTDFENGGNNFTATTMNKQLDKITAITSQVNTKLTTRGLLYNIDEKIGEGQTSLPLLPAGYFWKANGSGNLVAAICAEESGCSTLRSELLSQTEGAPGTDNIGIYDEESKSGKTLSEYIENLRPQKDDIPVVENKADETKKVSIDASIVGTGQNRKIIMPDNDVDLGTITTARLPRGYINQFLLINNVTEPTRVFQVSDGVADAAIPFDIINNGGFFYCKSDLGWEVGRGADGTPKGKMAAGVTWTADTWYYVAAISKPDGTVDIAIDDNATFTNTFTTPTVIDAGFSNPNLYRRIGFLYAKPVSSNIRKIDMGMEWVWFNEPASITTPEYRQTDLTSGHYSASLIVPPADLDVIFNCYMYILPTDIGKVYFYNSSMTAYTISETELNKGNPPLPSIHSDQAGNTKHPSSQIRMKVIGGTVYYYVLAQPQVTAVNIWSRAYKDTRSIF